MRTSYQFMLLALLAGALLWPTEASAQDNFTKCSDDEDVCLVDNFFDGAVRDNALRNAIQWDVDNGGVPEGRVYKLLRGNAYYNEDRIENAGFHLRIVGQTADEADPDISFLCGPDGDQDCGPAVIQMVTRDDGSVDQRMITGQDDITLKNLWITGQDDAGATTAYTPIQIDASNTTFTADNIIWERSNFALVHFTGENNDAYFTNSHWRNFVNTTQQWEGRGIQFSAGADTVVVENNTFFNIGMTVIQSEQQPLNYVRFNHNTMINVGRSINAGGIWREAYFTNNIIFNGFWHGEGPDDYNAQGRDTEYTGLFTIAELPPEYGTNIERKILFSNTATWRDPEFAEYYESQDPIIRAQPLFNSETAEFFAEFEDNMKALDNLENVNPGFPTYTEAPDMWVPEGGTEPTPINSLNPLMIENIEMLRNEETPATNWLWDPGRDPAAFTAINFIWPLPENFAYTNSDLMNAGTDDLPLGDLNWFPDAKESFLANREDFVQDIHETVAAPPVTVVGRGEFESGVVTGDATVSQFEGDTWYTLQPGTAFEWTFDVPAEKEYGIRLNVNMAGRELSGLDMLVNGTQIFDARGWDQFVIPPDGFSGDLSAWHELTYMVADMADRSSDSRFEAPADVMTLSGTNTLRIQSSWGENTQWAGVDIIDPDTNEPVVELRASDASNDGSIAGCDAEYCPSGFASVVLQNGGVEMNFDVPADGDHFMRLFYSTDADAQVEVSVDDQVVLPSVTLEAASDNLVTDEFVIDSPGTKKITISTTGGPITMDWMQLLNVGEIGSGIENSTLPKGYALHQNYPNPFNPSTTIRYEMAAPGTVTLDVVDVLGRKVSTLLDARVGTGSHSVQFDASGLASGLYFYRLETPVGAQTRKMVLIK